MLNGLSTVALITGGCPMSVITPFKSERRIGSFFGADHNAAMNKSVVGLITASVVMLVIITGKYRTAHDVGGGVTFRMSDVQSIGTGIGKHVEDIHFLRAGDGAERSPPTGGVSNVLFVSQ